MDEWEPLPSTAWLRNTFQPKGTKLAASDAPAAMGNWAPNAAYQKLGPDG